MRYTTTVVSVGEAGLTERPAVFDARDRVTVKVFRQGEEYLAEALAAELNEKHRRALLGRVPVDSQD